MMKAKSTSRFAISIIAFIILTCSGHAATITVGADPGDNYATIQEAIDAATAGDTIEVAAAYTHDALRITINGKNLTINGNGATIDGAIDIRGGSVVSVNDLNISGIPNSDPNDNSGWSTASSVGSTGARYVVSVRDADSSLTADNLNIDQIGFPDANITGIEQASGADVAITNSDFDLTGGNVYGFYMQSSIGSGTLASDGMTFALNPERQLTGNANQNAIIVGAGSSGAFPDFTITNYTFNPVIENDQQAYKVQLYAGGSDLSNSQINTWLDTVLVNNEISRVIYDSTGWLEYPSDVFNATQDLPAFTIQGAVDAAIAGDTIEVAPGIYAESPLIDKAVTLTSTDGRDVTTIQLDPIGTASSHYGAVEIAASDVTINGFTIIGNDGTATVPANINFSIEPGIDNVIISSNRIQVGQRDFNPDGDNALGLLTISTSSANPIGSLEVTGNIFEPGNATAVRAYYINPGVQDFVFSNNQINGEFTSSSLTQAYNGVVSDNQVTGTGASAGLSTWGYPDVSEGIGQTVFSGNTITGTSTAISLYDTNGVTVTDNELNGNGTGVSLLDFGLGGVDASTVTITGNSITNSSTAGVTNDYPTGTVDALGNYWGLAGGPEADPTLVSGDVNWDTWYTDASLTTLDSTLPIENITQNSFYASVQNAIDAANPGDSISVADGLYEETIDINVANLTVQSENGAALTTIQGTGSAASATTVRITADDVTLDGFTIDNLGAEDGCVSGGNDAANATIKNSVLTNSGRGVRGDFYGTFGTGLVIHNNVFDAVTRGVTNSENIASIVVTDNVFQDTAANAVSFGGGVTSVVITGNTFTNTVGRHITNYEPTSDFDLTAALNDNTFDAAAASDDVASTKVESIYSTISQAVAEAEPGATITVLAGSYSQVLTIDKPLSLLGPNAAISAVTGTRNAEAVLTERINISASDNVTVSGFEFFEVPATSTWTIYIQGDSNNFTFENNRFIDIDKDAIRSGITSQTGNVTVTGNLIEGMTEPLASGILLGGIYGSSTISDNRIDLKNAGYSGIQTPGATDLVISGNEISNTTNQGLQLAGACSNVVISDNVISNTNTSGGSDKGAIRLYGNNFTGPITITGNTLTNSFNGIAVKDGQDISGVVISVNDNDLSGNSNAGAYNGAASGTLNATENYWGEAGGPFEFPSLISGDVTYDPWYADAARTLLATASSFQDVTVAKGDTQTEGELYLGSGTTWTVEGTLEVTGPLNLADGSTLEVIDGELVLDDGSVLEGTFTFFNSLGSVNFNDDVSITGSSSGLILVSDVHVADGATITVDGNLVIDGSVVDSTGRFDLVVEPTGAFTMARTVFDSGDITLNTGSSSLYDNRFVNATISVGVGVDGAEVYHNITDDLAWLTDSGTNTVTSVDGWSNLTDASLTENNLLLGLDIGTLTDRTKDNDGNIYIQPADTFLGTVDVSALQAKISGFEVLLGYNTNFIDAAALLLEDDWDVLIESLDDDSTVIGKLDRAIGLSFDFSDPAGSSADQTVTNVEMTAGATEGETLFFHRVKLADDTFGGETRLTTGGDTPSYLTPFTANSGTITVDGTVPEIADTATNASVTQGGDDMTLTGAITIQGDLDITAAARDLLAGIDAVDAVVTLEGTTGAATGQTYTATQTGTSTVSVGGDDFTEYAFVYDVVPTTLNGEYNVVFTVTDRSGNESSEILGAIEINKFQVSLSVALQGLVAGPLTRDVVLVFTDNSGAVLETRTESMVFSNGTGSTTLTNLDEDSHRISAKTAWNLRGRQLVGFDGNGQATVDFTGANQLPGGDINGDNLVNMLDYSILRFHWNTADTTADITGSGSVGTADYATLQTNFYSQGEAQ